jgi:AcrR family transcriptional regulator/DNA-binding MarR family transcriptional regulator
VSGEAARVERRVVRGGGPDGSGGLARGGVPEIQRARILAALVEVTRERGVGHVSVAHVVARSGVSRRTFYELFEDREDCFLAAFDEAIMRAAQCVLPAYRAGGEWRARLRAALGALLEFLEDEPALGAFCVIDALGAGPVALERRAQVIDLLIDTVDEGRGEAKAGAQPTRLTAEGVVGAVLGVLHARLLDSEQRPGGAGPRSNGTRPGRDLRARGTARLAGGTLAGGTLGGGAGLGGGARTRRRSSTRGRSVTGLLGPLMGMIVLPYKGAAAAGREAAKPAPKRRRAPRRQSDPLRDLEMRLTYRTVRVLLAIASTPEASNRQIADAAGIQDQGQISKLLVRLEHLGLIRNVGAGHAHGEPNAWRLTKRGSEIERTIRQRTTPATSARRA